MINQFYSYRFEFFFFSQILILFGSLIVPAEIFDHIVSRILFILNLLAGILLLYKKKRMMWFLISLLLISTIIFGSGMMDYGNREHLTFTRMLVYFLFYSLVAKEIIQQVWRAQKIGKNVFFGLISGYISLGLIGFFICLSIEMAHPGSFDLSQLNMEEANAFTEGLMYFSYITMLTIGYGDVTPISPLAQKATVLIGLIGQIYLVLLTAIIVGKYNNQSLNNT